jgi:hypothetical protein
MVGLQWNTYTYMHHTYLCSMLVFFAPRPSWFRGSSSLMPSSSSLSHAREAGAFNCQAICVNGRKIHAIRNRKTPAKLLRNETVKHGIFVLYACVKPPHHQRHAIISSTPAHAHMCTCPPYLQRNEVINHVLLVLEPGSPSDFPRLRHDLKTHMRQSSGNTQTSQR